MAASPGVPAPVSSYSIDGGTPTIYNEAQDGNQYYNQEFYQSPVLSDGPHTIVVTNVYGNHAAYFLDYFLVVADDGGDTSSGTTTSPAPIVTTVVTQTTTPPTSGTATTPGISTVTQNPSFTSDHSSAISNKIPAGSVSQILSTTAINGTVYTVTIIPSTGLGNSFTTTSPDSAAEAISPGSNSKNHTGVIAGSIAAVAAVILSALVVYCWLRSRRRRRDSDWRDVSQCGFLYSTQIHLTSKLTYH